MDEDARAFRAVIEQSRRPADPARRAAALSRAADVPMRLVELAAPVAELAASLAAGGNPALRGDAQAAALLAQAAAAAAAALVRINLTGTPGDPRPARVASLLTRIARSVDAAAP
jgi:methenyltetrahydrofolate cyclohydrolase